MGATRYMRHPPQLHGHTIVAGSIIRPARDFAATDGTVLTAGGRLIVVWTPVNTGMEVCTDDHRFVVISAWDSRFSNEIFVCEGSRVIQAEYQLVVAAWVQREDDVLQPVLNVTRGTRLACRTDNLSPFDDGYLPKDTVITVIHLEDNGIAWLSDGRGNVLWVPTRMLCANYFDLIQ